MSMTAKRLLAAFLPASLFTAQHAGKGRHGCTIPKVELRATSTVFHSEPLLAYGQWDWPLPFWLFLPRLRLTTQNGRAFALPLLMKKMAQPLLLTYLSLKFSQCISYKHTMANAHLYHQCANWSDKQEETFIFPAHLFQLSSCLCRSTSPPQQHNPSPPWWACLLIHYPHCSCPFGPGPCIQTTNTENTLSPPQQKNSTTISDALSVSQQKYIYNLVFIMCIVLSVEYCLTCKGHYNVSNVPVLLLFSQSK